MKLVDKKLETNEQEIIEKVEENLIITYKYYEIAVNNEAVESVNTLEEAEELVNKMKESNEEIELSIKEQYTQNEEEVQTKEVEVAKTILEEKAEEIEAKKAEEARIAAMPEVKGIKLATKPVTGTITSRYGENNRNLRSSSHKGLDIGAVQGTPIKVVASGTVTFAGTDRLYGNYVKVDHGNGVETLYAHASKLYVKTGDVVNAEDVIAAVGSTGNSTGPHLHFEIKVDGNVVNPQNYLY